MALEAAWGAISLPLVTWLPSPSRTGQLCWATSHHTHTVFRGFPGQVSAWHGWFSSWSHQAELRGQPVCVPVRSNHVSASCPLITESLTRHPVGIVI